MEDAKYDDFRKDLPKPIIMLNGSGTMLACPNCRSVWWSDSPHWVRYKESCIYCGQRLCK